MPQRFEFTGFMVVHEDGHKDVAFQGQAVTPGLSADSPALVQLAPDVACALIMDALGTLLAAAYKPKQPVAQILTPTGPIPNLRLAD